MEELNQIDWDEQPKISFDELRQQVLLDLKLAPKRIELLKALFYYSKDTRKHSRIIKVLFWALVVPLLQEPDSCTLMVALRTVNQLLENNTAHEHFIGLGKPQKKADGQSRHQMSILADSNQELAKHDPTFEKAEELETAYLAGHSSDQKQNPLKLLINILQHNPNQAIAEQASLAIRKLAISKSVMDMLLNAQTFDLPGLIKLRFLSSNVATRVHMLATVSLACNYTPYARLFLDEEEFLAMFESQMPLLPTEGVYYLMVILRQLSKLDGSLEVLQGEDLRLTCLLIDTFDRYLTSNQSGNKVKESQSSSDPMSESDYVMLIFRAMAAIFERILKFYDLHQRLIGKLSFMIKQEKNEIPVHKQEIVRKTARAESRIIDTVIKLGATTQDLKTTLKVAMSLAHVTEVLNSCDQVATDVAICFMLELVKDTKNIKNHRQSCRYFANLSFYGVHRESLIKKNVAMFLMKAVDNQLDEDSVKHSAIALANLSSHKDFLKTSKDQDGKWKIKPLISLLQNASLQKVNLIQAASITLCNIAAKPQFHKFFVVEPEISTLKQLMQSPMEKGRGNEIPRLMLKMFCNLSKNPEVHAQLFSTGVLSILIGMIDQHENDKELQGNVVTAISYLSNFGPARSQIIKAGLMTKVLAPITQTHEIDQKMQIIALSSMLFSGLELQRAFIAEQGLTKLLFFLQKPDHVFHQLACKCIAILSEHEENLVAIVDKECPNAIILSCFRAKDVTMETLKETVKIFTNMLLHRKIKKQEAEVVCRLCDMALMVDDLDVNMLALFCLNALSENVQMHKLLTQSPAVEQLNSPLVRAQSRSLFVRLGQLMDWLAVDSEHDKDKHRNMVVLICSMLLNLASNDENRDLLLSMNVFRRVSRLIFSEQTANRFTNQTALCYASSIFAKLLKFHESRHPCIEEEGHLLLIKILENNKHRNLHMETLDTIKLFLTRREFLVKFRSITESLKHIDFESSRDDVLLSVLQVLAVLSFEKECHQSIKASNLLDKLASKGVFLQIFTAFEHIDKQLAVSERNQTHLQALLGISKHEQHHKQDIELALAVVIILANLSDDPVFVDQLLNTHEIAKKWVESQGLTHEMSKNPSLTAASPDFILQQTSIQQIVGLLNLITADDPIIQEQASVLLANLSHSDFFQYYFVSEKSVRQLMSILKLQQQNLHTEVSLLAVLISILNLSAIGNILSPAEASPFLTHLQEIVKVTHLTMPYVFKSVGVLAISNIYAQAEKGEILPDTVAFAFEVLKNWQVFLQESSEPDSEQIIKNLVYGSLVLFYNILVKRTADSEQLIVGNLIDLITSNIIEPFKQDTVIVNVVLELITLVTQHKEESKLLLDNRPVLAFVFSMLRRPDDILERDPETLKLAALTLCRLTQQIDESSQTRFIEQLQDFDDFEYLLTKTGMDENNPTFDFGLTTLEHISHMQATRDSLNCPKVSDMLIRFFNDKMPRTLQERVITILYNLQFSLGQPRFIPDEGQKSEVIRLPLGFLKLLRKVYKSLKTEKTATSTQFQRKIMAIVVIASANDSNHHDLVQSKLYTQMKTNINQSKQAGDDIELFGLVNIALNKKIMHVIFNDLKTIHRLADKSGKIDFKIRVDMFTEIAKFVAMTARSKEPSEEDQEKVKTCINALVYTLIKLTAQLEQQNFMIFKYFLTGILECLKNMPKHLHFFTVPELLSFFKHVLSNSFEFENQKFNDQVLNFSLQVIVCEIFFYLKFEPGFFAQQDISESVKVLIQFSTSVLDLNIDKKTQLVSNTLRLLCQMIASLRKQPEVVTKIKEIGALEFINQTLNLSKSLQPCINIDALFCLNNLMNIKPIALDPKLKTQDTVHKAIIIYLAYREQIDLDEAITTFLYSVSKYDEYIPFLQDKTSFVFMLLEKQIQEFAKRKELPDDENALQKVLAVVHNMSDFEGACKLLNMKKFIALIDTLFAASVTQLRCRKCKNCVQSARCVVLNPVKSKDLMHELALQTIINMCRYQHEKIEVISFEHLLDLIAVLYQSFRPLAKQFSLRLVTILTKQWGYEQLDMYKRQLIIIIAEFIDQQLDGPEVQLLLINLEKVSLMKKLMTEIALMTREMRLLVFNISKFLHKAIQEGNLNRNTDQVLTFLKRLSRQPGVQTVCVEAKVHEAAINYVKLTNPQLLKDTTGPNRADRVRESMYTVQKVLKLLRNLYEGVPQDLRMQVTAKAIELKPVIKQVSRLTDEETLKNDEELAVIIANIAICFGMIADQVEEDQLSKWLTDFSLRFIYIGNSKESSINLKWYTEKYILICELLVSKYPDLISREITASLLEVFTVSGTNNFTKAVWFRLLKLLAGLRYLPELLLTDKHANQRETLIQFAVRAYKETADPLCYLYFIRASSLLVTKCDVETMYRTSQHFKAVLDLSDAFMLKHFKKTDDMVALEGVTCFINLLKQLLAYPVMHKYMQAGNHVGMVLQMMAAQTNPQVVMNLCLFLKEVARHQGFYSSLLGEVQIETMLASLQHQPADVAEVLLELVTRIMEKTKSPVKYLVATKILKSSLTGSLQNVSVLLRLLLHICAQLESTSYGRDQSSASVASQDLKKEDFAGLELKTSKICYLAMTNLLLQTGLTLVIAEKALQPALFRLLETSTFERDTQMNLRVLYLFYMHFSRSQDEHILTEVSADLIDFLLKNLSTFRKLFDTSSPFNIDFPETDHLQAKSFFFENSAYSLSRLNAVKLSLCMSLKILQKASAHKADSKARAAVIGHPDAFILFRILQTFVLASDSESLTQVKHALKILRNCSETDQTNQNWAKFDSYQHLLSVANKLLNDGSSLRKKLLLPILQSVVNLCRRNGIGDFYVYIASPQFNKMMDKLLDEHDEEITECVNELLAGLVAHKQSSDSIDLDKKLSQLANDGNPHKVPILAELHNLLQTKHPNSKLRPDQCQKIFERLSAMLHQLAAQKESRQPDQDLAARLIKLVGLVYQRYRCEMTVAVARDNQIKLGMPLKQTIESESTLTLVFKAVQKFKTSADVASEAIGLATAFSQSNTKQAAWFVSVLGPMLRYVLEVGVKLNEAQVKEIIQIVINMQPENHVILNDDQALPSLLLALLDHDAFKDSQDADMHKLFESLLRSVFLSQVRLNSKYELIVHSLLESKSADAQMHGVVCLQCLALCLSEPSERQASYLGFLSKEEVLSRLTGHVRQMNSSLKNAGSWYSKFAKNTEIKDFTRNKIDLSIRSLQTLVVLTEFASHGHLKDQQTESLASLALQRVFIQADLLNLLVRLCTNGRLKLVFSEAELALFARAFASLSPAVIKDKDISVFTTQNDDGKFNCSLFSIFRSITAILEATSDQHTTYLVLYAATNMVSFLPVKNSVNAKLKREDQMALLTVSDLDYLSLSAIIAKSGLLTLSLAKALQGDATDEVIRISTKLLIAFTFKAQNQRVLIGQPDDPKQSSITEVLFDRFNMTVQNEKQEVQSELKKFIGKLHRSQFVQDDHYVQFVHLISQILQQTSTPTVSKEEQNYLLPTDTTVRDLVQVFVKSMQNCTLDDGVDDKRRRELLFKLFFFNYSFALIVGDLVTALVSKKPAETDDTSLDAQAAEKKLIKDILGMLFQTLGFLKEKRRNTNLDLLLKQAPKITDGSEVKEPSEMSKTDKSMRLVSMQDSFNNLTDSVIEDKQSACLAIAKMTLANINKVLDIVIANFFDVGFVLDQTQLETIVSLVTCYEETGDIVEQVYTAITKIVRHSSECKQANIKVVDHLNLLQHCVKHATFYKCREAYKFIKLLVKSSAKYSERAELESAIAKIKPVLHEE